MSALLEVEDGTGELEFETDRFSLGDLFFYTAAIGQVHAKYDYLEGDELKAFEQRAALLKGLPPLNIEKLYVITEDDQLRDGEMVLFIGLRVDCVTTVFGLPTRLYNELAGRPPST